jgi:ppGpp synthetase/RelA/SpoT-type nucleotidyltranferase
MAWATPLFEKPTVNKAGRALLENVDDFDLYVDALTVINNWRAIHAFPLNTFQMNLRRRGKKLDPDCLIAQRIKRLSSIEHKLQRFPQMKLSQMQDIGGCRAIVKDVSAVSALVNGFTASDVKHHLATRDDYILNPKKSGYRGVHLVAAIFPIEIAPITTSK